ncbi:coiled-coil domain-containing protein [[Mycoplasma] testudinis]|uniref:hypothetical protein n=1 Tax=[Mycoplasma] testudinis TaxID=33924 RepID=UPI000485CC42|nr:hypothetical protein [[Mycoplasma] testudinis]
MKNTQQFGSKSKIPDLDQLEPNDFYSQKRETKVNRFSLIGESLNETPTSLIHVDHEQNKIELNDDESVTAKLFKPVDAYERERKAINQITDDAITNEILQVDLPNDSTFIDDVVKDYDSKQVTLDFDHDFSPTQATPAADLYESTGPVKEDETDPLFDMQVSAPIIKTTEQKTSLSDFVPTKQLDDGTDALFQDEHVDPKLKSIAAAVEDAALDQEQLHMSVQIALDDLKKHENADKETESAILQSSVSTIHLDEPVKSEIIQDQSPQVKEELKTYFVPAYDANIQPEPEKLQTENLDTNFEADEIFIPVGEPKADVEPVIADEIKTANLEKDDDELFAPAKRQNDVFYEFKSDEFDNKNQSISSLNDDHHDSFTKPTVPFDAADEPQVSWQAAALPSPIRMDEEIIEKIREYANQEVQKQMEIEHAKIELERMRLNEDIVRSGQKQKEAEQEQLDIIENARIELEKDRLQFEEQKQKIADELVGVSKNERDQLASERLRIIEEAQRQKEELIEAAKQEIKNERERLEAENQKLRDSLVESIRENQKYLEMQRQDLLDAAQKEKERLIEAAKKDAELEKENVLAEVKNLLNELRDLKGNNDVNYEKLKEELSQQARDAIKNALADANVEKNAVAAEVEKFSTEQKAKFDELLKELDVVKQNAYLKTPDMIATTLVDSKPEYDDTTEFEMIPGDEDRSYTECPIDSIELDDLQEEPTKVYELKTADVIKPNTNEIVAAKPIAPTSEFNNDVRSLRDALKAQNIDFDFQDPMSVLNKEKVKDEIKKEILQELTRAVPTYPSKPSSLYLPTSTDFDELETSYHEDLYETASPKKNFADLDHPNVPQKFTDLNAEGARHGLVRLQKTQTVPELISSSKYQEDSHKPEKLYDLDLFEELGMDSYLENDNMLIETLANDLDKTFDIPKINNDLAAKSTAEFKTTPNQRTSYLNLKNQGRKPAFLKQNKTEPVKTVTKEIAVPMTPVIPSSKPKRKLRGAELLFKDLKAEKSTSTKDFVKAYAQQLLKKRK